MPCISLADLTHNECKGAGRTGGVLEHWQKRTRATLHLILLSSVGAFREKKKTTHNLLEVLIILFVNNHLLLSDQEPA